MNRAFFRRVKNACRGLSDRATLQMCRVMVEPAWIGPLSDEEQELSSRFMAVHAPSVWYHGGAPGLSIGDILLPAKETGLDPRGFGNAVPDRLEHVYITGEKKLGACFAEQTGGNLFRVRPIGDVIVDPVELRTLQTMARIGGVPLTPEIIGALPVNNYCCPKAEIVGIEAKFWGWE